MVAFIMPLLHIKNTFNITLESIIEGDFLLILLTIYMDEKPTFQRNRWRPNLHPVSGALCPSASVGVGWATRLMMLRKCCCIGRSARMSGAGCPGCDPCQQRRWSPHQVTASLSKNPPREICREILYLYSFCLDTTGNPFGSSPGSNLV